MLRLLLVFISILGTSIMAQAQSLAVISHYPASAHVAKRLLPFTITGGTDFKILKINFENGGSCSGMTDPFYSEVFHIFCREAEVLKALISVLDENGELITLEVENISVAIQRAPESTNGEASTGGGE